MRKIALVLIIVATPIVAPAKAAEDTFTPRLIEAIQNYLRAYEVCLRRVITASPVLGRQPEQIAKAAVKTCRERDADIRRTKKRVYGFPSVDNFMAGTDERISAFSVALAKAHVVGSRLR